MTPRLDLGRVFPSGTDRSIARAMQECHATGDETPSKWEAWFLGNGKSGPRRQELPGQLPHGVMTCISLCCIRVDASVLWLTDVTSIHLGACTRRVLLVSGNVLSAMVSDILRLEIISSSCLPHAHAI